MYVKDCIFNWNILYHSQYGFRKKQSTIDAIVAKFVYNCLPEGYRKPRIHSWNIFHTINRERLLRKLEKYGIRDLSLDWSRDYLTGCRQYVKQENHKYEVANLTCGVPQGFVLGPLLFLICINGFPKVFKYAKAILFADNTNIFTSHKCIRILNKNLNEELAKMLHWLHCDKLFINQSKNHYILITKTRTLSVLELILNGSNITTWNVHQVLGVYIDDKLTWHEHIHHCKSKLASSLFAINVAKRCLSPKLLLTLYNSLVYPYLAYSLLLCGSSAKIYTNTLFTLQKRAARIIAGSTFTAHTEVLFPGVFYSEAWWVIQTLSRHLYVKTGKPALFTTTKARHSSEQWFSQL